VTGLFTICVFARLTTPVMRVRAFDLQRGMADAELRGGAWREEPYLLTTSAASSSNADRVWSGFGHGAHSLRATVEVHSEGLESSPRFQASCSW
jgi:hypothetical protein